MILQHFANLNFISSVVMMMNYVQKEKNFQELTAEGQRNHSSQVLCWHESERGSGHMSERGSRAVHTMRTWHMLLACWPFANAC